MPLVQLGHFFHQYTKLVVAGGNTISGMPQSQTYNYLCTIGTQIRLTVFHTNMATPQVSACSRQYTKTKIKVITHLFESNTFHLYTEVRFAITSKSALERSR